jgi:predicted nucleic acid-binding protein
LSEGARAVPTPWVPDSSVLIAVARDDHGIMTLIQNLDAAGRPLVIPVLAMTAASLDMRTEDTEALLHGLEQLGHAMTAPVADAEQAVKLAEVISRTGLDPWDAHVAAVADAAICPILTLNGEKWRQHATDLDEPLHIIEIADTGEHDPDT